MYKQEDTIHFACKQCGKCCPDSPNMHFYDMLELSDEFIFQTSHNVIISYANNPLDKSLLRHYQSLGNTIMIPEVDASLFYYIDFSAISYPSYNGCSKLIDNICSIYGKRPSNCRISPFDIKYEDTQQWRVLNFFKENTEKNDWKCDFTDQSPVVYKDQQIYNNSNNSLYFSSVDSIRNFTDQYIQFLGMHEGNHQSHHFKALFHSALKNTKMISDMIVTLQIARYYNIISEQLALNFITNQIKLIDNEINKSVKDKNKINLQTTRLYKKQKEDYIKAIEKNIFNQQNDNFTIQG